MHVAIMNHDSFAMVTCSVRMLWSSRLHYRSGGNTLLRSFAHASFAKLPKMTTEEVRCPLTFEVKAECPVTKARTGRMQLVHHHVDTPVFMPVGTQVNNEFLVVFQHFFLSSLLFFIARKQHFQFLLTSG